VHGVTTPTARGHGSGEEGAVVGRADGAAGRRSRWPFLLALGVPAFGTTFAITAVTTYLPSLIGEESGPLVTGAVIAGEGGAGLLMPILVGLANDRTTRTVTGRLRYVLLAVPFCLAGLLLVATDLGPAVIIAGAGAYFVGHFAYLTPYEALYPDLVPAGVSGRSRTAASSWRFAGLGAALVGGGFLLDLWVPAVFLVAAGAVALGTAVLVRVLWCHRHQVLTGAGESSTGLRSVIGLLRDRDVAVVLGATLLWNVGLQGLKAFVVLFFTIGLGRSAGFVSGLVFPLVAVGLVAAVPVAGRVADRVGHRPVLAGASAVYGAGLLGAGLTHSAWMIALIPLPAAAAGTVMTLNYSALMRVLPAEHHGAASGLFLLSRGAGCLVGPLAVGLAVTVAAPLFPATRGYDAMWFVIGPAVLAAVPLLLLPQRTATS
jgi:Na+/melibiose symporter-like transporter